MIDRRSFVGTLLASLVGSALAPADVLWTPAPTATSVIRPDAFLTLEQMTAEVLRVLMARVPLPRAVPVLSNAQLGDVVVGRCLNEWWETLVALPTQVGESGLSAATLHEAAMAIATRMNRSPVKGFGIPPPCEVAGMRVVQVTDSRTTFTVRGSVQRIHCGYTASFDVLYAS